MPPDNQCIYISLLPVASARDGATGIFLTGSRLPEPADFFCQFFPQKGSLV
jgi:hypothetical protein